MLKSEYSTGLFGEDALRIVNFAFAAAQHPMAVVKPNGEVKNLRPFNTYDASIISTLRAPNGEVFVKGSDFGQRYTAKSDLKHSLANIIYELSNVCGLKRNDPFYPTVFIPIHLFDVKSAYDALLYHIDVIHGKQHLPSMTCAVYEKDTSVEWMLARPLTVGRMAELLLQVEGKASANVSSNQFIIERNSFMIKAFLEQYTMIEEHLWDNDVVNREIYRDTLRVILKNGLTVDVDDFFYMMPPEKLDEFISDIQLVLLQNNVYAKKSADSFKKRLASLLDTAAWSEFKEVLKMMRDDEEMPSPLMIVRQICTYREMLG